MSYFRPPEAERISTNLNHEKRKIACWDGF